MEGEKKEKRRRERERGDKRKETFVRARGGRYSIENTTVKKFRQTQKELRELIPSAGHGQPLSSTAVA